MANQTTRMCATCQLEYRIEKMGVYVVEMASFGAYKIWSADLHKCPKCGHLLIAGFADYSLSEHHEEGFNELLKKVMESGDAYLMKEYTND